MTANIEEYEDKNNKWWVEITQEFENARIQNRAYCVRVYNRESALMLVNIIQQNEGFYCTIRQEKIKKTNQGMQRIKAQLIPKDLFFDCVNNKTIVPTVPHKADYYCSIKSDGEDFSYYGRKSE